MFPEAKVILTVRDPGQWYDSMANTLYRLKLAADDRLRTRQERLGAGRAPAPENRIWRTRFPAGSRTAEHAIAVFERHNAEVVQNVPASRLLVYQVREGWRPLCAYLGVEVPAQGFPHVNSTELFVEYNRAQLSRT